MSEDIKSLLAVAALFAFYLLVFCTFLLVNH